MVYGMKSNLIFSSSFLRYALCALLLDPHSLPAIVRREALRQEGGPIPNSIQSGTGKGSGTSIRRGSFIPGEL